MGKVIGIDLGTTNSVAAFLESQTPEIILTSEGDRLLPSVVAFTQDGERLIGNPAKSQLITNPTNTISSVKRLMGKRFSEVKPYLHQFPYKIIEGKDDTVKIVVFDMEFSPEEISAMILRKLKESAEQYLGDEISGAVLTVPAYFNDSQRKATRDAGEIAGLNVLRIINEPTAASLAFSLDLSQKSNAVVYDFGGGTIDISVLEIKDEVIRVLATAGDTNLGGNDLDDIFSDYLKDQVKKQHNIDLSGNKLAMQRIRDAAEMAKKELSGMEGHEVNLPFIADTKDGPAHFSKYIHRKEFEKLVEREVDKTIGICKTALLNANLTVADIDEVLVVGGSTRIPYVQKRVQEFFGKAPNKKVNPDEIVAMGAAIQGAIVKGISKDVLLLDVTPFSLGVKTFGGAFTKVIAANTTIPTNRSLVFSTVEDNQGEVEIMVYQGEREEVEENKLLGNFTLTGIKNAPRGVPRIEVTFSININGILKVSAVDLSSKSANEVVVSHSGLLSEEDIERLKEEAEKFKQSDLVKKELVKKKNDILRQAYGLKKHLSNPAVGVETARECKVLIEKAETGVDKESEEEMDKILVELMDMNRGLELLTGAEGKKFEDKGLVEEQRFDVEKAVKESGFQEERIQTKNIVAEVLEYVSSVEKHLGVLDLEREITDDCLNAIKRARKSMAAGDVEELEKVHKELKGMEYNLSIIAEFPDDKKLKPKMSVPDFRTQRIPLMVPPLGAEKAQDLAAAPQGMPEEIGSPQEAAKPVAPGNPQDTAKLQTPGKATGTGKPEEAPTPPDTGKPQAPGKQEETGKPGGNFDLEMYDDITFKKEDTRPFKFVKPKK
ncbi:MAG: molecular chaperone DnaK [Candidatus Aminicenantes bacterium]|nr:molecular chaperone DnaK [Candidatus Aminicenantes bacterium]